MIEIEKICKIKPAKGGYIRPFRYVKEHNRWRLYPGLKTMPVYEEEPIIVLEKYNHPNDRDVDGRDIWICLYKECFVGIQERNLELHPNFI